ncbi:MAG: ATP-binding protein [Bacteroidales bacterium]|nr:ATP-binding protein [Bacteroidales bacterium]
MFSRLKIEDLRTWANKKERKPLVLRGARQVGKTSLVKMFGKEFEQFLYLNLELKEEKALFENDYSFQDMLAALFLYGKILRSHKKTLIFIDEIQNSPKAVAFLRYFYEETPDLYIITAGSLLENIMDQKTAFPAGRVEYMLLRPCSFREFLIASNEKQYLDILTQHSIPDYAHGGLLKLFFQYTLIGGMPEIVNNYKENRDISRLSTIYESLILSYLEDVEKYANSSAQVQYIRHIINSAFAEAGKRITFEKFGNSEYKSREIKEAFLTLEKTMLVNLVYPQTSHTIPLLPNRKKKPRLHVVDTGLMNYKAGLQLDLIKAQNIENVYKGNVSEHITGQELLANERSALRNLSFWVRDKKSSTAELDYIQLYEGQLIPIEVKSGSTGKLKSLLLYMDESGQNIAIRIHSGKYSIEDIKTPKGKNFRLFNIPFYLIFDIKNILSRSI